MALLKDSICPELDVEVARNLRTASHTEVVQYLAVSLGSWNLERDRIAADGEG